MIACIAGCGGGSSSGTPLAPINGTTVSTNTSNFVVLPSTGSTLPFQAPNGASVTVTNSAPTVATVTGSPTTGYTVNGLTPGTTVVTLTPSIGTVATYTVVVPAPLSVAPSAFSIALLGTNGTFTASESNYTGAFTIQSNSTPAVVSIAPPSGGTFTATATAVGSTTVTVADSYGQTASTTITVPPQVITLSPSTLSLNGIGATATFTSSEVGYSGTYSILSNSAPGVATVVQTSPGVFTVTSVAAGTTTVTIGDTLGHQASLPVGVTAVTITVM